MREGEILKNNCALGQESLPQECLLEFLLLGVVSCISLFYRYIQCNKSEYQEFIVEGEIVCN